MKTHQQYYTEQVEEMANELGFTMFETKEYTNCGVWTFRKENLTKNIYFDFQSNFAWFRLGKGNMYNGERFDYGNARQEEKALDFIFQQLCD